MQVLFLQSHSTCFGRLRQKHVEWLCRNKTCTVLHQVGVSFHLALIRRCDDLPTTITHVPVVAVLVLNTPDDGRLRQKHVEWLCRNKTCTVLHQVGVSFDLADFLNLFLVECPLGVFKLKFSCLRMIKLLCLAVLLKWNITKNQYKLCIFWKTAGEHLFTEIPNVFGSLYAPQCFCQIWQYFAVLWIYNKTYLYCIAGAFIKSQKTVICFVMSPSARPYGTAGVPLEGFLNENLYFSIGRKSVTKTPVWLKYDQNNGYFTWITVYTYDKI